ncbi:MAG: SDR family oxidoreductase [Planctomycetota bacterium]|jgi:rhamnose utilization protein RhaD (predicted bifunctional aldolase and dehydrogenase)/NAD(P)-dependent dehydrogenase (short-subunit alcohol dehydrogenase family)
MVSPAVQQLAEVSRRLGADESLVLMGGGNTSCKAREPDALGRERDVLHLKPSGVDLKTIEAADFCTLRLDDLVPLRERESLADEEMMAHAMGALVDPAMRQPSIEVLLHAFLPDAWVLHSHADALLALTNHPRGEQRVADALGARVAVVPYMRPGFALAQAVARARAGDPALEGIVLMKHGLVTFGDDADTAYRRHLDLVARCAETAPVPALNAAPGDVAKAREWAPLLRGAMGGGILLWDGSPEVTGFLAREDLAAAVQRGPATADHVLRIGRAPAMVRDADSVDADRRILMLPGTGIFASGENLECADENLRIGRHTLRTVAACGADWEPIDEEQMRHVEDWPLQANKSGAWKEDGELAGRVALITGGASGIGRAIAKRFAAEGAHLVLCDLESGKAAPRTVWVEGDISAAATVERAFTTAVDAFGGVDIVVSNAGIARPAPVEEISEEDWERSFGVNARAHFLVGRAAMRLLRAQGLGGAIVFNASKNVLAPGKGFAAYSAAKAAEAQFAKVLALEAADIGVRVNILHPDAVFSGTRLWTADVRRERARAHGVPVEELEDFYARRNLLKVQVRPQDVAEAALFFASDRSSRTTGAYLTVDGGVREAFGR